MPSGLSLPCLLDRLSDDAPRIDRDAAPDRLQTLRQLKASLRRDIEWLFNSKARLDPIPEQYFELRHSIAAYGLPDLTGRALSIQREQADVAMLMEELLHLFEPRLRPVNVYPSGGGGVLSKVRFQIAGILRVDPAPEHIVFDSSFDPSVSYYRVEGE
ncbi:MAG: type VI secretion system baseplate subunit TssE [Acidobacteria bacterium]|nr:type VI secretion system baseplate subunit TssE [Acidobacteriota bacterium]